MRREMLNIQMQFQDFSFYELNILGDFFVALRDKRRRKPVRLVKALEKSPQIRGICDYLTQIKPTRDEILFLNQTLGLLRLALAPVPYFNNGSGHIEIKKIKGNRYAYVRVIFSGGDWDRRYKTVKSYYVGKAIAQALDAGIVSREQVLDAFHGNQIEELTGILAETLIQMQS